MTNALSDIENQIIRRGRIEAQDVLAIRRIIYPDGFISIEEANWLFNLNDQIENYDPAWRDIFIEALTDFMVNQLAPQGYVSPENVSWLLTKITRDGQVRSDTELDLLVNILDKAISTPEHLAVFTLREVQAKVLRSNRISAREVHLLRRVLYAAGGQQSIAITRGEAEVIYAIHDARHGAEDDPAWTDLFVKALLNHLMFASGFEPPSREEALQREKWLEDTTPDPARFMRSMAMGLRDIIANYRAPGFQEEYLRRREAIQIAAETVTDEEAHWLAQRILRDGSLSAAERMLIEALRAEQPQLHPVIQSAIDRLP
ncbi:hypothetical protein [Aestuariivirga sp.]|uniref:hypothetical protein n=1 Tax=Aestuariivirga sp. TaxID=2650926 RepID=UPI003BABC906